MNREPEHAHPHATTHPRFSQPVVSIGVAASERCIGGERHSLYLAHTSWGAEGALEMRPGHRLR